MVRTRTGVKKVKVNREIKEKIAIERQKRNKERGKAKASGKQRESK